MYYSIFLLPIVFIICASLLYYLLFKKNLSIFDPVAVYLSAVTVTFLLHLFSGLYTITYVTPFGWFIYLGFSIAAILFAWLGSRLGVRRNRSQRVFATTNSKLLRSLVYALIACSFLALLALILANIGTLLSVGLNAIREDAVSGNAGSITEYVVRFAYLMFLAVPLIIFHPHIFTKKERVLLLSVIVILGTGRTLMTAGRWPLFLTILVLLSAIISRYNVRRIRGVWVILGISLAGISMIVLGQLRSKTVAENYNFQAQGHHPWMKPFIDFSPTTAKAYFQSVSYITQGIVNLSLYLDGAEPNRRGYLTTRFIQLQLGTMSPDTHVIESRKLNMPIFLSNPKDYMVVWATGYRLFIHDYGYIGGLVMTALLAFLTGYLYHANKYRRDVANLMALAILYPSYVMLPIAGALMHPNFLFLMNGFLLVYLPVKLLNYGPFSLKVMTSQVPRKSLRIRNSS